MPPPPLLADDAMLFFADADCYAAPLRCMPLLLTICHAVCLVYAIFEAKMLFRFFFAFFDSRAPDDYRRHFAAHADGCHYLSFRYATPFASDYAADATILSSLDMLPARYVYIDTPLLLAAGASARFAKVLLR